MRVRKLSPLYHPADDPGASGTTHSDCREQCLLSAVELGGGLSKSEHEQLQSLLADYSDVFALDPSELGTTDVVQLVIETRDSPPIRQQARRIPFALRSTVDGMVSEML